MTLHICIASHELSFSSPSFSQISPGANSAPLPGHPNKVICERVRLPSLFPLLPSDQNTTIQEDAHFKAFFQSEDSPSPKRQRLSHSVFDYTSASPAPSPPMRPWEMTSNRQPPSVRPNQHHFSGERCNTPARNRRRLVITVCSFLYFHWWVCD